MVLSVILSRKYLSCEITINAPEKEERKPSSHSTALISRWLVGSSSKSKSALESKSFARISFER